MIYSIIKQLIPILTLIVDIGLVLYLILIGWKKLTKKKYFVGLDLFLKENYLYLSLIIALAATLGSLFYSEILGYNPCKLCWYQRIAMYPLVLLFATALIRKLNGVAYYTTPLVITGGLLSLYHYITQLLQWTTSCASLEDGASCAVKYTFSYGYITIPMMALTAFIGILILLRFSKK